MNHAGCWIVVTGVRDLAPASVPLVEAKITAAMLDGALGFVFGGARGVDTIALFAADHARFSCPLGPPPLVVIVPGRVEQQPSDAQYAIRTRADTTIQLAADLSRPASFHARNAAMLAHARSRAGSPERVHVLAFPGRDVTSGGTRACIALARLQHLEVDETVVEVLPSGKD